jgi:hypothetical protein
MSVTRIERHQSKQLNLENKLSNINN